MGAQIYIGWYVGDLMLYKLLRRTPHEHNRKHRPDGLRGITADSRKFRRTPTGSSAWCNSKNL
jgi:hypothetical protein